ncbi:MAG: hypothetical protein JSS66_05705 [Armatimonadetes bacterium]|nr:hypothetical protein [Armatimonadota bacterium]
MPDTQEIKIPLAGGGTLCCGPGESRQWGGYLRVCDARGNEVQYWDQAEWRDDPELVIGAVFALAAKN